MIDFNVGVVIPAAGKSERFTGDCPKQYFSVKGKPLFLYSVEAFICIPYIKKISLVVDRVEYVQELLLSHSVKQDKLLVTSGGPSRHASIKNGLNVLKKADADLKVVIVHDGARPMIPKNLVDELVVAAVLHGACGPTRPLTSTILRSQDNGLVDVCLDRVTHVASETPQAFLFEILCEAYQKSSAEEIETGTECLQLVLKHCGVKAKLLPGPECLWKVTQKKDLYAAEACLREMSTKVCLVAEQKSEVVTAIDESLRDKVAHISTYVEGQDDKPHPANVVICVHEGEIDQGSQIGLLADVLDVDETGLIIHIVMENSGDALISGSVYDLLRSGRSMMNQYEKLKKGVVIIHFSSPGEEERLVRLITSLIRTDPSVFSGQTLFV